MRRFHRWKVPVALLAFALAAAACTSDDDGDGEAAAGTDGTEAAGEDTAGGQEADGGGGSQGGGLLQTVQDRGTLVCGVNDAVPGFGFVDDEGNFSGFDVEFCRVIAAGVLGDSEAVEFTPLTADERFTALQSGEIDVLSRNTTWTATRDGTEGASFAMTTFYDGQGIMARSDSGIGSIADLDGTRVCVLQGTTTELNLATLAEAEGLQIEAVTFEDNTALQAAFEAGQCDAWTSDKSQLAGVRSAFPEGPEALTILDETISKEPLGPVTRDGDTEWYDAVNWSVIAPIQAEEFGISSENLSEFEGSDNPEVARFLGQEDPEEGTVFDPGLGLATDYAATIIEQVGNYAEIYDRNVGPDTPLGLERGLNNLWNEGGLLYPPPYR